jgi:hypothetical protein
MAETRHKELHDALDRVEGMMARTIEMYGPGMRAKQDQNIAQVVDELRDTGATDIRSDDSLASYLVGGYSAIRCVRNLVEMGYSLEAALRTAGIFVGTVAAQIRKGED